MMDKLPEIMIGFLITVLVLVLGFGIASFFIPSCTTFGDDYTGTYQTCTHMDGFFNRVITTKRVHD